ncbi:hypothetical protein [Thermoactinomyces mirandus]|uniref:Uncharacterized protein n=1 Tax=Thermoactinomyces mirandus TaxID=2756294 RepID=A0A7W1XUW8_9BACL|nr:hypothetical protein [Thermoactinomyces mirandus]MBA4603430.1 hypothetical protein [Thermoactinomyces mirandus]
MKNYGEELAYWYLRLNGFFVLDNFVYHKISNERDGDADLLAIRLPNVKGKIGGRTDDWDETLFKYFGEYEIAAVLCEVKTGKNPDFNKAFKDRKLKYALNRIGFAKDDIDRMFFEQQKRYFLLKSGDKKFLKLVISEYVKKRQLHNDSKLPFLVFSLQHIEDFIYKRINRYSEKYSARHMFPSSLLQYMMYKQRENSKK